MKLKYISLGNGLEKTENGFSGIGYWNLYKCFYEDEGRYGEFFFNLNTERGEAEICRKDYSYGPVLIEAFKQEFDNTDTEKELKNELIDWNKLTDVLVKLSENSDKTISRHSKGLLQALKL